MSYRIKLLVSDNCYCVQADLFQTILLISGAITSFLAIVIFYCNFSKIHSKPVPFWGVALHLLSEGFMVPLKSLLF